MGSGKSYALIYQALFCAALNPGLPGLLGAPTYPMLRDATLRTMFDVLNDEGIEYDHRKTENVIMLPDAPFHGAEILCRALEEFERLRGTNLAWFGIDELTYANPAAWSRLEGRLRHPKANRRCGFAAWTPRGFDWVYERFISEPPANYRCTLASPRENHYVTNTGLYDALAGYDERLYRQEVLGEYLSLTSGTAYYSFDRKQNVKEVFYDRRLPLLWSLDFNVNPMCSVIAQIEEKTSQWEAINGKRNRVLNILDELYLADSNTPEACEEFVARTQQYARGNPLVIEIYGDATGTKRQSAVGAGANSDWAVVKEFFRSRRDYKVSFRYKTSNPGVRDRVGAVNSALCSTDGVRKILIHPRCKYLIRDFERVTFKPGTSLLDQVTDPQLTHLSDAAGYLIDAEFGLREAGGPRSGFVA